MQQLYCMCNIHTVCSMSISYTQHILLMHISGWLKLCMPIRNVCCSVCFTLCTVICAEYEDLNGGCPTPANTSVRPAYIQSNDPTINDIWSYYRRVFTFQVSPDSDTSHNSFGEVCCRHSGYPSVNRLPASLLLPSSCIMTASKLC